MDRSDRLWSLKKSYHLGANAINFSGSIRRDGENLVLKTIVAYSTDIVLNIVFKNKIKLMESILPFFPFERNIDETRARFGAQICVSFQACEFGSGPRTGISCSRRISIRASRCRTRLATSCTRGVCRTQLDHLYSFFFFINWQDRRVRVHRHSAYWPKT